MCYATERFLHLDNKDGDLFQPLPELKPLKSLIPGHLFGDAVMILECVNAFKSVFDFKQFFPKGFTWSECWLLPFLCLALLDQHWLV